MTAPIIIVGGGIAGLSAALALAPLPVLLLSKSPIGTDAASPWAQGGIAAAIGADDSPALHAADTIAAGDGLCDPDVVARIVGAGPGLIDFLETQGARFDRAPNGSIALGLEAAHARRRIVHVGDATGRAVTMALADCVYAAEHITVRVAEVGGLARRDGAVHGVYLRDHDGTALGATAVILATGGIGGLFAHTTNPPGSWGQGLLFAARAGATLADLEFVQFHPTALDVGENPMPLISEAVRGEGAVLIDETGARFMAGQGRAELEPRDIVARAVFDHIQAGHRVFLDARTCLGTKFARRFPSITMTCARFGIDPATDPIPIRPAAHYHMGGIEAGVDGRTNVANLYAIGECARTGLHGANRLASNSLLEAGVCGRFAAEAIKSAALQEPPAVPNNPRDYRHMQNANTYWVGQIATEHLGVLRDEASLQSAGVRLNGFTGNRLPAAAVAERRAGTTVLSENPRVVQLPSKYFGQPAGPARVAMALALCALRRRESRGAHARTDYPDPAARAEMTRITGAEVMDPFFGSHFAEA